jgi:hypothetical protein
LPKESIYFYCYCYYYLGPLLKNEALGWNENDMGMALVGKGDGAS